MPGEDGGTNERKADRDPIRNPAADAGAPLLQQEHEQREHEKHAVGAGQRGERAGDAGDPPLAVPGSQQAGDDAEQKERFGVNGGEEKRGREERERPQGGAGDALAEVERDQAIEQDQREHKGDVGDQPADDIDAGVGRFSHVFHRPGIERPKGGFRGGFAVAIDGDQPVPQPVPLAQRVDDPMGQPGVGRGHLLEGRRRPGGAAVAIGERRRDLNDREMDEANDQREAVGAVQPPRTVGDDTGRCDPAAFDRRGDLIRRGEAVTAAGSARHRARIGGRADARPPASKVGAPATARHSSAVLSRRSRLKPTALTIPARVRTPPMLFRASALRERGYSTSFNDFRHRSGMRISRP